MDNNIFLELLNRSIAAGWLLLAVLLLRLLLHKAPRWSRCLLWGIVGLRLVMPFTPESAWSLIPSAQTIDTTVYKSRPYIQSGVPVIDNPVNGYLGDHYFEGVTVPTDHFAGLLSTLSVVWIVGMLALLLYGIISYARLHRRVQASLLCRENIYYCDAIASPFILGLFRPRIYLPSGIDGAAMESVIAHERAHLARKDHIWKPIGFVLLAVYWFNPLVWLAYLLLCRDIEQACDEKVVKKMDSDAKKGYAEALLACSVQRRWILACPLAFGEVGVKDRIRSVLHYKKPAFWIILVAVAACIVTAVCFLTNPIQPKGLTRLDTHNWQFSLMEQNERVIYCAADKQALYPEAKVLDLSLQVKPDTLILQTSSGSGGEGSVLDYKLEGLISSLGTVTMYDLSYGDTIDGYATAGKTTYFDSWEEYTLILHINDYTLYFTDSQSASSVGGADQPAAFSSFNAVVLEIVENGLTMRPLTDGDASRPVDMFYLHTDAAKTPIPDLVAGSEVQIVFDGIFTPAHRPRYSIHLLDDPQNRDADSLAAGITNAILDHYKSEQPTGLIRCESHVTLASRQSEEPSGSVHKEYMLVRYQEFAPNGGDPILVNDDYIPTVLTFTVTDSGEYVLQEYWTPSNANYHEDLRAVFPEAVDAPDYTEQLYLENRQKAKDYLNAIAE